MTLPCPGLLLYDGDCAFCTTTAAWFTRHLRSVDPAQVRPWHPDDALRYGIHPADAAREIHWVGRHGGVLGGADAVLAWWRTGGIGWRLVAGLLGIPGVHALTRLGYRAIAANRHRLPGRAAACSTGPVGVTPVAGP